MPHDLAAVLADWDAHDDAVAPYSPVCSRCKHNNGERSCTAFGNVQVPLSIWTGRDPHRAPWPGDRGARFEPLNQDPKEPA